MQFDGVEARILGVARRLREAGDDPGNLLVAKFARGDVGLLALRREDRVAVIGMGEGATGVAPPLSSGWQARPPCQICNAMRPPLSCTASVTRRQPSTCALE